MATLTLPPDYFRAAAERFKENPTDRYEWLTWQKEKAYNSLLQYQSELITLQNEMLSLGAEKGQSGAVATIGAVIAAIPAGYTQIIGGLVIVGASFFSKAENKRKLKRVDDLKEIGQQIASEAEKVGAYYDKYRNELLIWQVVPVILILIILTRK